MATNMALFFIWQKNSLDEFLIGVHPDNLTVTHRISCRCLRFFEAEGPKKLKAGYVLWFYDWMPKS